MVNKAVEMKTVDGNSQIAIVTINRPQSFNSITIDVLDGLLKTAEDIAANSDLRVVILAGEGGYFSSGADFSLFASAMNEADTTKARTTGAKGANVCKAWESLPQVTIAAIEGGVVGGALAVAMACDWRVMAEDSYAYIPEVKMGVNFGWGALPRLTALVGAPKAKQMSILCQKHNAEECVKWGLADYVSKKGEAIKKAMIIANEVSMFPGLPVQLIKRGINVSANALASAAGYADLEDLLLCMKDNKAAEYRSETIREITKKGK